MQVGIGCIEGSIHDLPVTEILIVEVKGWDDSDACVAVGIQASAVGSDLSIPTGKVCSGDAIDCGNSITAVSRLDVVELVACLNDTWLNRAGCSDARIQLVSRLASEPVSDGPILPVGRLRRVGWLVTDNIDTSISIGLQRPAIRTSPGIPLVKFGEADSVGRSDASTSIPRLD